MENARAQQIAAVEEDDNLQKMLFQIQLKEMYEEAISKLWKAVADLGDLDVWASHLQA